MASDPWLDAVVAPDYLTVKPKARYAGRLAAPVKRQPRVPVSQSTMSVEKARRYNADRIRAEGGQVIEAPHPGLVQSGYDALEGGIAGLNRLIGYPEDRAQQVASSNMDSIKALPEGLLGLTSLERSARNIVSGHAGADDALNAGLMLAPEAKLIPGARQAGRFAVDLAGRAAERVLGKRAAGAVPAAVRYMREPLKVFGDRPAYDVAEHGGELAVAREGVSPQIVPEARTAKDINALRVIMRDPERNPALRLANEQSLRHRGVPFSLGEPTPVTSLQRQSGIARAMQTALEGSPEYKHATFEAYGNQMPEVVGAAQNYDQLMENAYRALGRDATEQFDALPLRMRYHNGEGEYPTPSAMFRDVLANGNLNVFRGGDPHDFLSRVDPLTGLSENEKFRAVHDYVGHVAPGSTFRPGGEEVAYAAHARTLSPLARIALLSETRGQNSLVNYSGLNADLLSRMKPLRSRIEELRIGDRMRGQPGASASEIADLGRQLREMGTETQFAPQKTVVLPPEYLDPMSEGGIPEWLRSVIQPQYGTAPERAVHLSHTPGLTGTDPAFYGTGHRGDDWAIRGRRGSPAEKTSFYLGPEGTVRPEQFVASASPHAYETQLSGLYDINQDPESLVKLARAYNIDGARRGNPIAHVPDLMRMVREGGYRGVRNPDFMPGQGAADVFDPVGNLRAIERGPEGYADGGFVVRR